MSTEPGPTERFVDKQRTDFMHGVMFIQGALVRLTESFRWRRGREMRTPEVLARSWEERFGIGILRTLVNRIDGEGSAWIMDRHGNFILRMRDGSKFFVGSARVGGATSQVVQKRGGRGLTPANAIDMALIHHSLGKRSIRLISGTKKLKGLMWAGARLTGLEVTDYRPDERALALLAEMRQEFEAEG